MALEYLKLKYYFPQKSDILLAVIFFTEICSKFEDKNLSNKVFDRNGDS
jgi:hypothetical protein